MTFAYGPFTRNDEPPAPVGRLTPPQRRALVLIFYAGEMNRSRRFYIADGSEPVTGTIVGTLHEMRMVALYVERRRRPNFGKIFEYRYYVKLTQRGEWYATTLIKQREKPAAALCLDNFEDSPTVYASEPEAEVLEP